MSAISNFLPAPPDNFSTTLSGTISDTALSIPLNSVSGLGTEGVGVLFKKGTDGAVTAGSIEFIHWTNVSGSSLTLSDTGDRGLTGSSSGAQAYSSGDFFEVWVTSYYHASARTAFLGSHLQSGEHNLPAKAFANINAPRGFLLNGKIVPSVNSNNLTVALKTLSGDDPSASNPIYVRISDTVRTISAATSFTLNAGTNWFSAGSAELATQSVDYFAYLIWDSVNSIVKLTAARFPYGNAVSDFSSTSAAYNYGPNLSATGSDDVEVIGRYAATLSAGAGYTWSVPTYNGYTLVQRPIWESRWLAYAPQPTNLTIGNGTITGAYKLDLYGEKVMVTVVWGSTTSASSDTNFSVPFPYNMTAQVVGGAFFNDSGSLYFGQVWSTTATTIQGICGNTTATYLSVLGVGPTTPFTWGSGDIQKLNADLRII